MENRENRGVTNICKSRGFRRFPIYRRNQMMISNDISYNDYQNQLWLIPKI
jgi:hypothetical protein